MHPRFAVGLPIAVRREGSPEPGLGAGVFQGECLDVSKVGLRYSTRTFFNRCEKLEVTIMSRDGQTELRCEVEVVRAVHAPGRFEVGAKITRMLPLVDSEAAPKNAA
jgi:hypothetical protein